MTALDTLSINTIRVLCAEAVQRANSGHPGMPMGMAAPAYVLWKRFLRHNPSNPDWPDRDRFILSAGHGSTLLYTLLHLSGYELTLDDIRNFRQWRSRTPGHPERGLTPGVEMTTGPLGQGFAHAVGMALARRYLAKHFNRPGFDIVSHDIYVIASDGDLMEGVSHEAASLAGHLALGHLICLYDDNRITIEGSTALSMSDDTRQRFESYGWQVSSAESEDLDAVSAALEAARAHPDRPNLIMIRSHLAEGSPHLRDCARAHGAPLGADELRLTKLALGCPEEPEFCVPDEVRANLGGAVARGAELEGAWLERLAAYGRAFPGERAAWEEWHAKDLPHGWDDELWQLDFGSAAMATRVASGRSLNAIARRLPNLVGGSADLGESNQTIIESAGEFAPGDVTGPNIHFGVREHAMAAALNGMSLYGGIHPYGGTFLVFSDYMRPALRLAALMQTRSIFVFTHDSIGLGEDGPTHQPVEQLASLRAIPGLTVIRPADANDTRAAWWVAMLRSGPTALVLSRQKLPALVDRSATPGSRVALKQFAAPDWVPKNRRDMLPPLARGAYIVSGTTEGDRLPDAILIASGSEVSLCLAARELLSPRGVHARVISMPSWELFEEQPAAYREYVLPQQIRARIAVEAASPLGWERYVGSRGAVVAMKGFGASAPERVLFEQYGFTPAAIAARTLELLGRKLATSS